METQAALVGADGAVHLHAETAVDLHAPGIVDPRHTEDNGTLRFDHALDDGRLHVVRVGFKKRPEGAQHLFHGLMELGLVRITLLQAREEKVDGLGHYYTPYGPEVWADRHEKRGRMYQSMTDPIQCNMSYLCIYLVH